MKRKRQIMEYKAIKGVKIPISRIVLGCDSLPFHTGEGLDELLEGSLKLGINAFDTAHKYGNSERLISQYINTHHLREKVVVISKACHPTKDRQSTLNPTTLRKEIEESLSYFGYLDIFLLHRDDTTMDLKEMLSILNEYREQGKIRVYGVSNWKSARIAEANEIAAKEGYAPFMVSNPHYSLAEWIHDPWGGVVSLSGESNINERKFYIDDQMPVFAYSPLGRGYLSGRVRSEHYEEDKRSLSNDALFSYDDPRNKERLRRCELLAKEKGTDVPSIALAFLFSSPMNVFAIIGSTNLKRLEDDAKALEVHLSEEEMDYLDLVDER